MQDVNVTVHSKRLRSPIVVQYFNVPVWSPVSVPHPYHTQSHTAVALMKLVTKTYQGSSSRRPESVRSSQINFMQPIIEIHNPPPFLWFAVCHDLTFTFQPIIWTHSAFHPAFYKYGCIRGELPPWGCTKGIGCGQSDKVVSAALQQGPGVRVDSLTLMLKRTVGGTEIGQPCCLLLCPVSASNRISSQATGQRRDSVQSLRLPLQRVSQLLAATKTSRVWVHNEPRLHCFLDTCEWEDKWKG